MCIRDSLQNALFDGSRDTVKEVISDLHPADASDLLEQLPGDEFEAVVELLGDELPSEVLIELRDEYREDAVEVLTDAAVVEAIDRCV